MHGVSAVGSTWPARPPHMCATLITLPAGEGILLYPTMLKDHQCNTVWAALNTAVERLQEKKTKETPQGKFVMGAGFLTGCAGVCCGCAAQGTVHYH